MPVIILRFEDFKSNSSTLPDGCPYCGCQLLQRWGAGEKPVHDARLEVCEYHRYRCNTCGRTFRHYVRGIDKTRHTRRIHQIAGIAWALGLSARDVVAILAESGIELSYMTVWRDGNNMIARFNKLFDHNKPRAFCIEKVLPRNNDYCASTSIVVDLGSGNTVVLGSMDVADYREVLAWLDPVFIEWDIHVSIKDTHLLIGMDLPDLQTDH